MSDLDIDEETNAGEMMWNYRVVHRVPSPEYPDYEEFFLIEAYYEDEVLVGWHNNVEPYGESIEELNGSLALMATASEMPVLEWEELPREVLVTEDDEVPAPVEMVLLDQDESLMAEFLDDEEGFVAVDNSAFA